MKKASRKLRDRLIKGNTLAGIKFGLRSWLPPSMYTELKLLGAELVSDNDSTLNLLIVSEQTSSVLIPLKSTKSDDAYWGQLMAEDLCIVLDYMIG